MTAKSNANLLKKVFLWFAAILGGFPLNTHRGDRQVIQNSGTNNRDSKTGRQALGCLKHNVSLMEEAVARYLAVLSAPETCNTIEGATVLRKTYQRVRAGFNSVDAAVLPPAIAKQAVLLHEVFHEASLLCGAADMSGILGGTDYGVGFEHLTTLYQPGANMFQPEALRITDAVRADFVESTHHFAEVKQELDALFTDCQEGKL